MGIKIATYFILILFAVPEFTRFYHSYYDCIHQNYIDLDLLSRDVCGAVNRIKFRHNVDCEGAEKRQRLSIFACSIDKWAETSYLMVFSRKVMSSYLYSMGFLGILLLFYLLPASLFSLHLWSKRKSEQSMLNSLNSIIAKTQKKYRIHG